ncbi:unnamed protein product [Closterium sp. NIES-53]
MSLPPFSIPIRLSPPTHHPHYHHHSPVSLPPSQMATTAACYAAMDFSGACDVILLLAAFQPPPLLPPPPQLITLQSHVPTSPPTNGNGSSVLCCLDFSGACEAILTPAAAGNGFLEERAPWSKFKQGGAEVEEAATDLVAVLETARCLAVALTPITPTLARNIYLQQGFTAEQFSAIQWPPQQPEPPAPPEPPRAAPAARAARAARAAKLPYSSTASTPTGVLRPSLLRLCDRADGLSLFDLTSGVSPAPPATADSTVRSQWATRDAAARLAVRRHLPTTEHAHFSQYRSAQTLYDAVVARYSSPATAALSRLFLPYLFPDLAAFPTVADLITHHRTSDTRHRAALPAEFCAKNPPPLYLTLYYVVTDALPSVPPLTDASSLTPSLPLPRTVS